MTPCVAFVSVCVGATQRISLSILVRNPHKGPEGEFSRETRSRGGKEGPREERERQLTKEGRREQSDWDSCPEKETVSRRRMWEDGSRSVKWWVSIPCGFVEVSRNYSSTIACKWPESCTKVSHSLPPSLAWNWPKSVFLRLFFSSTLSVVFCVSVKKCVMFLVGNERNH